MYEDSSKKDDKIWRPGKLAHLAATKIPLRTNLFSSFPSLPHPRQFLNNNRASSYNRAHTQITMPKKSTIPTEISGYTVLPLRLPAVLPSSFPDPVTHYIYIRPHEPRIPNPDAARSLFLVNIPVDTTELHLRHLFSSQLSAGRVERVVFDRSSASAAVTKTTTPTTTPTTTTTTTTTAAVSVDNTTISSSTQQSGRKRKRQQQEIVKLTAADLQAQLSNIKLPSSWDRALHRSGSHAVVTFVDRPAMEASLKAVRKKAKGKVASIITWGEGIEDRIVSTHSLGSARYRRHVTKLRFPAADELLGVVDEYMSLFARVEETRASEAARRAQEPDDDGFVTVTKGPRFTDVAREEEVKELVERQRKREEGLGDFYRFQTREKRKERQNDLLRRFEEDKRKIEKLKKSRGKIMVCCPFLPPFSVLYVLCQNIY